MAITKVTSGLISADASSIDLNIDAGTLYLDVSENRVGIGTTSPSKELDVVGTIKATGADNANTMEVFGGTTTNQSFGLLVDAGTSAADYAARFRKSDNTVIMEVSGNGNVGIGTDNPASKLHIFDGGSSVNNTITFGNPSATPKAEIKHTASGNEFLNISCKGTTSGFGNIAFYTGPTPDERMRIDSSGNVGIGTSSPSAPLTVSKSTGYTEVTVASGSQEIDLFTNSTGSTCGLLTASNIPIIFYNNSLERMRIDSSGNLLINNSTGAGGTPPNSGFVLETGGNIKFRVSSNGSAASQYYNASGTIVGSVVVNASSTAYNTSSDYRLKENVDYDFNALNRVAQLKPARFNFIADADTTVDGFLAHEVQDIVPEAITGEKDGVDDKGNPDYQVIDQSKLVPLLTKAIQELSDKVDNQQTIINDLKTRIETLENA